MADFKSFQSLVSGTAVAGVADDLVSVSVPDFDGTRGLSSSFSTLRTGSPPNLFQRVSSTLYKINALEDRRWLTAFLLHIQSKTR